MKRIVVLASLLVLFGSFPMAASAGSHAHRRHVAHHVSHSITVWVNTNSGVYHYPGERWYGRTEEGQYMTEQAAIKAGYRATRNGQ